MKIEEVLEKDVNTLTYEDFACSWQAIKNIARFQDGKIACIAYCASYMPNVQLPQDSKPEECKALFDKLQASPQYKHAESQGWLTPSEDEILQRKQGKLSPIQGQSLAEMNQELRKRGFQAIPESEVMCKEIVINN